MLKSWTNNLPYYDVNDHIKFLQLLQEKEYHLVAPHSVSYQSGIKNQKVFLSYISLKHNNMISPEQSLLIFNN